MRSSLALSLLALVIPTCGQSIVGTWFSPVPDISEVGTGVVHPTNNVDGGVNEIGVHSIVDAEISQHGVHSTDVNAHEQDVSVVGVATISAAANENIHTECFEYPTATTTGERLPVSVDHAWGYDEEAPENVFCYMVHNSGGGTVYSPITWPHSLPDPKSQDVKRVLVIVLPVVFGVLCLIGIASVLVIRARRRTKQEKKRVWVLRFGANRTTTRQYENTDRGVVEVSKV